jgi:hypothetical protein
MLFFSKSRCFAGRFDFDNSGCFIIRINKRSMFMGNLFYENEEHQCLFWLLESSNYLCFSLFGMP